MAADQALYLAKREGRDRYLTNAALVERLAEDEQTLLKMLEEVGPQLIVAAGHAVDRRLGRPRRSSLVAAVAEAVGKRAGVAADYESLRAARLAAIRPTPGMPWKASGCSRWPASRTPCLRPSATTTNAGTAPANPTA